MSTFRQLFADLLPEWLSTGDGGLSAYALSTILDAFAERTRLGVLVRFPRSAPADALAAISRDRKILRGIGETAEGFAERCIPWLDEHRVRGNPFALMRRLQGYAQAAVRLRTVDRAGNWYTLEADGTMSALIAQANWDWDGGAAAQWARFWVILYPTATNEPWGPAANWGDGDLWGVGQWGTPGATIGTTATVDHVADVRRIIADWKPAGTKCEWVITAFDAASFDPTVPAQPTPAPGTWGRWGVGSGATFVPARIKTARYWRAA